MLMSWSAVLRLRGEVAVTVFVGPKALAYKAMSQRRVECEFVFDRHAAAEVSAAYAVLVPQRRARIRAAQEGVPHDDSGDLRPGVLGQAEEERDHRVADRGVALARRRARRGVA